MEKMKLEGMSLTDLVGHPMEEIQDYLDSRRSNFKGTALLKNCFGENYDELCIALDKDERRKLILFLCKIRNYFFNKSLEEREESKGESKEEGKKEKALVWQNDQREDLPEFVKEGMVLTPLSPELVPISENIPMDCQAATRLSIGLYDGWMYSPKLVGILLGITEAEVRSQREKGITYLTQLIAAEQLKRSDNGLEEQAMTLSRLFKNNEEK